MTPADYAALVAQVAAALQGAIDPNAFYNPGAGWLFSDVLTRPNDCGFPGFCTNENIGQDTGDAWHCQQKQQRENKHRKDDFDQSKRPQTLHGGIYSQGG